MAEAPTAPAPFVTLHLSDIHFGQEKGEAVETNKDARDQLVRKVRDIAMARRAAEKAPIGSLIITGDIAYSGHKTQFDDAVAWLAQVSDAAGCDPLSVQVVPGNHDVDRGKSMMVSGLIKDLFRYGKAHLAKALDIEDSRAALYKRMAAYDEFASGYGCKLDTNGGNAGVKEHVFAPGRTLRIVGLNSALMCSGQENNKKPKLLLGARQRIIPELDDVEYVVLVHHPMSWLRDGEETQKYIDNRARILMCGHEHRPNVTVRPVEGNAEILIIDAGATVPDQISEEYTYAFNVVDVALAETQDAIDVTVDTYRWKESEKRFHQDRTDHVDGEPRQRRLVCPKFQSPPGAVRTQAAAPAVVDAPLTETAASDAPQPMIEPIDLAPAAASTVGDAHAYASVRSAFFHKLGTPQRLKVLVELRAIPEGIETLTSNMMLMQLDRLHREGKTADLVAAVAAAEKGE